MTAQTKRTLLATARTTAQDCNLTLSSSFFRYLLEDREISRETLKKKVKFSCRIWHCIQFRLNNRAQKMPTWFTMGA